MTTILDILNEQAPTEFIVLPRSAIVTLPDGGLIDADLAANPTARRAGLSEQRDLDPAKGMLFVYPNSGAHAMWMRDMKIALDIIWLDARGMIVGIRKDAPPVAPPADQPVYGREFMSRFVLELAAGQADAHGLAPGQFLQF